MLLFWFFLPSVRSLVVVLCWLVVLVIDRLFTYLQYPRQSRDSTMRTRQTVPYTLTKPSGEKIRRVTTISPTGVKTIRITQLSPATATSSEVAHDERLLRRRTQPTPVVALAKLASERREQRGARRRGHLAMRCSPFREELCSKSASRSLSRCKALQSAYYIAL